MEPIAALSLACNVLQLIDYGIATAGWCKEIYKNGQTTTNDELAKNADHLRGATENLSLSISKAEIHVSTTPSQKRLRDVATKTTELVSQLQLELDKLKPTGSTKKRNVILLTFKSIGKAKKIGSLNENLIRSRDTLQHLLVTDTYLRQDAMAIQKRGRFEDLDEGIESLIRSVAKGEKAINDLFEQHRIQGRELTALLHIENQRTRDQYQQQEDSKGREARREKLMQSLKYPEMNLRRNQIEDAHGTTFEWIFKEGIARPWDSFPAWLKNGNEVYWINGKAGSGKSTLMKLIHDDARVIQALGEWHPEALVLSYFLWSSGSDAQRSSNGLLCSLILQLLQIDGQAAGALLKSHPNLTSKDVYADWSNKELNDTLLDVIELMGKPICIFLDGIDEFDHDEGYQKVLGLIRRLTNLKRGSFIKVCLSSRPEAELQRAFTQHHHLKLQDLTEADIRRYANDLLQRAPKDMLAVLTETIIVKAEGVFLWVHLALKSLLRGLDHGDGWEDLMLRLKTLPKGLNKLYQDMWDRLNDDLTVYKEDTSWYFHYILKRTSKSLGLAEPSLLEITVAKDESVLEAFLGNDLAVLELPVQQLIEKCESTEKQIMIRCAGLLEVVSRESPDASEDDQSIDSTWATDGQESGNGSQETDIATIPEEDLCSRLWYFHHHLHVVFIHRSVVEFLENTDSGKSILSFHDIPFSTFKTLRLQTTLVIWLVASFSTCRTGICFEEMTPRQDERGDNVSIAIVHFYEVIGAFSHLDEMSIAEDNSLQLLNLNLISWTLQRISQPTQPQPKSGCYNSLLGPDRLPAIYEVDVVDFVGLAATFGYVNFVKHWVDEGAVHTECEPYLLDYLLLCTFTGWWFGIPDSEHLKLQSWLLEKGANADVRATSTSGTPVSPLLMNITSYLNNHILFPRDTDLPLFVNIVRLFVEKGVDLSAVTLIKVYGKLPQFFGHGVDFGLGHRLILGSRMNQLLHTTLSYLGYEGSRDFLLHEDESPGHWPIMLVPDPSKTDPLKARKVRVEDEQLVLRWVDNLLGKTTQGSLPPGQRGFPPSQFEDLIERVYQRSSEEVDLGAFLKDHGYVKSKDEFEDPVEKYGKARFAVERRSALLNREGKREESSNTSEPEEILKA